MYHPLPVEMLSGVADGDSPVVLLDTARPGPEHRYSRLFLKPRTILRADKISQVPELLEELERQAQKHWVAGYLSYEAGLALEPRLQPLARGIRPKHGPFAWFGVYDRPYIFDHWHNSWNRPLPRTAHRKVDAAEVTVDDSLSPAAYRRCIARIKRYIAAGDTYQVNFTFDKHVRSNAKAWDLYLHLRAAQPVPYAAFIRTESTTALSFSPELFFAYRGSRLWTRPMKGTATRGRTVAEDLQQSSGLAKDPKNRAENIMIVDLIRNDLGRVCRTGTVAVERMFEVETHPTLHQMTSTISGSLPRGVGLSSAIRSLFPCGSVTGAPKIRTMEIIDELEEGHRGVYCGAIGYARCGEAAFSVPIRTLQQSGRGRTWQFRMGSGIVWDSDAQGEWEECTTKAAFAADSRVRYELIETLLYHNGYRYLREHAARMSRSARSLGIPFVQKQFMAVACSTGNGLRGPHMVRILLSRDGRYRNSSTPLAAPPRTGASTALLSRAPVDSTEPLLRHKTTHRPWFERAATAIGNGRCFDVLFFNERGELTEGARSNVFVRLKGRMVTPPVECGLLPGVLRRKMLARGACTEQIVTRDTLERAEAVYCGNSVRGLTEVHLGGTLR